ncbi:MAG: hypothetical protein HY232_10790 [Acidobacteria bacterium]|nr:hypothetical protein [Acidobacteriota bacterium]
MPKSPDIFGRFFEYRATAMQSVVAATRDVIDHALSKGIESESVLAEMLASFLPTRFDARKGFLIDAKGTQSHELDLILVDRNEIARMFDFKAFELVPVEAATACVEVKTSLTKAELEDTFVRFQKIQEMAFFEEKVMKVRANQTGTALVVATTSRPELTLFAYEAAVSNEAIKQVYDAHPKLAHVKICVLTKGIVADIMDSPAGNLGRRLIVPVENSAASFSGRILALFLYQLFLPAVFEQTKGVRFYAQYLQGEARYLELK